MILQKVDDIATKLFKIKIFGFDNGTYFQEYECSIFNHVDRKLHTCIWKVLDKN
jgi:hypothetical protein